MHRTRQSVTRLGVYLVELERFWACPCRSDINTATVRSAPDGTVLILVGERGAHSAINLQLVRMYLMA